MICQRCEQWVRPLADKSRAQIVCPACADIQPWSFPPLFIVTGPSGAGKTAIVPELQGSLPAWEVFETDILWDSGGDWKMVKANWFRIAASLARRPNPRPTILCGTFAPEDAALGDADVWFGELHFLALTCEEDVLRTRLERRPKWRGADEAFIAEAIEYRRWLIDNGDTAFSPPLAFLDTSGEEVSGTAGRVSEWATDIFRRWQERTR